MVKQCFGKMGAKIQKKKKFVVEFVRAGKERGNLTFSKIEINNAKSPKQYFDKKREKCSKIRNVKYQNKGLSERGELSRNISGVQVAHVDND